MALKQDWSFQGIPLINAVHRVETLQYRKASGTYLLSFAVAIHAAADSPPIDRGYYEIQLDSIKGNLVERAYIHLKSLPAYATAVDV